MSYLIQERNESCLKYASINENPIDHYSHLFFTNGNGVDFFEGNPVRIIPYGRYVLWTDYYKSTTSFSHIRDYITEYELPNYIEHQLESTPYSNRTFSEVWDDEIIKLNNIIEITLEQMFDSTFWLDCLKTKSRYFPYNNLSDGYFKLQQINEHTEFDLFKVAIAVVDAFILFYQDIVDNKYKIECYKPILSYKWFDDDIKQCYDVAINDLKMLKIEQSRLRKINERT